MQTSQHITVAEINRLSRGNRVILQKIISQYPQCREALESVCSYFGDRVKVEGGESLLLVCMVQAAEESKGFYRKRNQRDDEVTGAFMHGLSMHFSKAWDVAVVAGKRKWLPLEDGPLPSWIASQKGDIEYVRGEPIPSISPETRRILLVSRILPATYAAMVMESSCPRYVEAAT